MIYSIPKSFPRNSIEYQKNVRIICSCDFLRMLWEFSIERAVKEFYAKPQQGPFTEELTRDMMIRFLIS